MRIHCGGSRRRSPWTARLRRLPRGVLHLVLAEESDTHCVYGRLWSGVLAEPAPIVASDNATTVSVRLLPWFRESTRKSSRVAQGGWAWRLLPPPFIARLPASPSSSGAKSQLLRTQGDPRCRCELRGVRRALLDRYQRPILGANGGPRALTRSKRKPA